MFEKPGRAGRKPSASARRQVKAWQAQAARGRRQPKGRRFMLMVAGLSALAFAGTWYGSNALLPDGRGTVGGSVAPAALVSRGDALSARFAFCHSGGGTNCVVDGDTFWFGGEKYRIADIDTPETHPSRCAEEARLGTAATNRLRVLLNAGPFTLESADRDTDRYGRKLRVVTRGGASIGDVLVNEGLARAWVGRREPWC